jgi:MarR family transcriptional regulator for hemolysin
VYDFTGRWVALAHKAVHAEFDRRLSEAGGSLSTWQVLRAARLPAAPSQTELARTLSIKGSTLVRHLDRMAADGLIERRREASDRRVLRIHITRAGEVLLQRLTTVAAHSERAIAELLPPAELEAMRHSLRVIAEHFGTAGATTAAQRVAS